eukprot:Hpha_TRINITY_DN5244_c0_g1::TRINITY_DN5244_c0_g1_i1::g.116569::m.116569
MADAASDRMEPLLDNCLLPLSSRKGEEMEHSVSALCVRMLEEMGFPPHAVQEALADVRSGEVDPTKLSDAADHLNQAHPSPGDLDALTPLISSHLAGVFSVPGAEHRRWAGDDDSYGSFPTPEPDLPRCVHSAPEALPDAEVEAPSVDVLSADGRSGRSRRIWGRMPVWIRHTPELRPAWGPRRLRSGVDSGHTTPASQGRVDDDLPRAHSAPSHRRALPHDLLPGAAWAVPRGVASRLLRCARAEARVGVDTPQSRRLHLLVSQGRLQDAELMYVLRLIERGPHSAQAAAIEAPRAAASLDVDEKEVDCAICFGSYAQTEALTVDCPSRHVFCRDCMRGHIESTLLPKCPGEGCGYELTEGEVMASCGDGSRLQRFRDARLQDCIDLIPGLVRCPREGCENAIIAHAEEGRFAWTCEECGPPAICTGCRDTYHHLLECEEMPRAQVQWQDWMATGRAEMEGKAADPAAVQKYEKQVRAYEDLVRDERWKMENCRLCPHCNRTSHKTDGCDSMICGRDAPDKGYGNVQQGCGRNFHWASARPYKPKFTADDMARRPAVPEGVAQQKVHRGKRCCVCGREPIPGVRLECAHCPPEMRDLCGDCDVKGSAPQGHDQDTHVRIIHPEGDSVEGAEDHEKLMEDADKREREHRDEWDRQERLARWQRRRTILARCVATFLMVGLIVVQVVAIFTKSFSHLPDRVDCSGPVADACACAREPSAPMEKDTQVPGLKDFFTRAWMVVILIAFAGLSIWLVVSTIAAIRERLQYGSDDEDYIIYRRAAATAFAFWLPFGIFISLCFVTSVRKHLVGEETIVLTPAPPPQLPPSAGEYYRTWWVILIALILLVSCIVCTCMFIVSCNEESEGMKPGFLCLCCCFIPALVIVCMGSNANARQTLLGGRDANITKGQFDPLPNETHWEVVAPGTSDYFSSAWVVGLMMVSLASCMLAIFGAWVWVSEGGAAPLMFSGTCVLCVFIPASTFLFFGASASMRDTFLPTRYELNTTGHSASWVKTWHPHEPSDRWCGLLSCDAGEDMFHFLTADDTDFLRNHMRWGAALAIVGLVCQVVMCGQLQRWYHLHGINEDWTVALMWMAMCTFLGTEIASWATLVTLSHEDLCEGPGWSLFSAASSGLTIPLLVSNTFLWPVAVVFGGAAAVDG